MNYGVVSALVEVGAIELIRDTGTIWVEILGTETVEMPMLLDVKMFGRMDYVVLLPWGASQEMGHSLGNASPAFAAAVAALIREREEEEQPYRGL